MDNAYNSTNLEIKIAKTLDYIIGKNSSEIRENDDTDLINSEIEEGNVNCLDIIDSKRNIPIKKN